MDKAKKKQSAQVALHKPDEAQTENDECTQPENSDGGNTEGVLLSDSQSCSSASSPSTKMLPIHPRRIRAITQSPHFLLKLSL